MKTLLTIAAVSEAAIGVALLVSPSVPVSLLLGTSLGSSGAEVVARVAGAALLALAVACWVARVDARSGAARGLIAGMLLYNVGAVAILAHAGLRLGLSGAILWPTVVFHAGMAIWCAARLRVRAGVDTSR